MKIPYVKRFNAKYKSIFAKNLKDLNPLEINAYVDKKSNVHPIGYKEVISTALSKSAEKIFGLSSGVFVYASDDKIYAVSSNAFKQVGTKTFSAVPNILDVFVDGEKTALVLDGSGKGYKVSDDLKLTEVSGLPLGTVATVYNGMLFIAKENQLYFSAPMGMTDFTMDLTRGGVVRTDESDGQIVALCVQNGKLLIFTENAIYSFSAYGERIDYSLKKIETDVPVINASSVKDCGEKTLFVSEQKLCSFVDGKIQILDSILDGVKFIANGSSAVADGIYYIPVKQTSNDKKYFLRHDVKTDKECLIESAVAVIGDGGYTFDANGKLTVVKSNASNTINIRFKLDEVDFNTPKEKVINEISAVCVGDGALTISGEYGSSDFELKDGNNVKRINFPARTFNIEFSGKGAFNVKNVRIKYRIKGE